MHDLNNLSFGRHSRPLTGLIFIHPLPLTPSPGDEADDFLWGKEYPSPTITGLGESLADAPTDNPASGMQREGEP
jgi:hypothetical protein